MDEVVNLIKLKRNSESLSLNELEVKAKKNFESLDLLLDSNWSSPSWQYIKRSKNIKFSKLNGEDMPVELERLSKIFIVNMLWNQRLKAEPYSHSYISSIHDTFKIWAEMGVSCLTQINQNLYDQTLSYLRERYADPESCGVRLNKVIRYLNESHLLIANIDTKIIRKALGNTDSHGRVLAKKKKMPLPDLVRAIIHLKWSVDDKFDGSAKAINDKLCILTQIFQYGLGLRMGEVLRLPKKPLIEMEGETFCLVWTEKGSSPLARYVPTIWRSALKDAVDEIHRLTNFYRKIAVEIEKNGALTFLDDRLSKVIIEKENILAQKIDELDCFFLEKRNEAEEFWKLKKSVDDKELYELKTLNSILPVSCSAGDPTSLIKYYKANELEIVSKPIGSRKHKHFANGSAIKLICNEQVNLRTNYISAEELREILYGRKPLAQSTKDSLINEAVVHRRGAFVNATFRGGHDSTSVSRLALISREKAIEIIAAYFMGGYDNKQFIPIKVLEKLLPELFNQKSASKDWVKKISGNEKVNFYQNGPYDLYKTKGYLADITKLKNYFLGEYEQKNLDIEKELLDNSIREYEENGIEISSKSFSIKQQPSEYLFIRAGMRGGEYFDFLPEIIGYNAVRYFFIGNDRHEGAFTRYDIEVDGYVADGWQSHQGRHWQTTSLFRAGLAEMVVNKWMGRTTGQGENYDHNTGQERAKVVGEAMLDDTERFLGDIPSKVKIWKDNEAALKNLPEHLNDNLQTVQYSPLGYCTRDLFLRPCEFNLRCLTGNNGKGCKHYIYDLHDPAHREKVTAERDKSSLELSRLFEVYEKGVEAAVMHIEHHMIIVRNTSSILENAELILYEDQLEGLQEYMPFKKEGTYPDDCPFQCGGDE